MKSIIGQQAHNNEYLGIMLLLILGVSLILFIIMIMGKRKPQVNDSVEGRELVRSPNAKEKVSKKEDDGDITTDEKTTNNKQSGTTTKRESKTINIKSIKPSRRIRQNNHKKKRRSIVMLKKIIEENIKQK